MDDCKSLSHCKWESKIPCLGILARPSALGRKSACPNLTCGNFSDVPPLEASEFELIRAWLARPVWPRDGAPAVMTPARDLIQPHLSLSGVRQTDDDHAVV